MPSDSHSPGLQKWNWTAIFGIWLTKFVLAFMVNFSIKSLVWLSIRSSTVQPSASFRAYIRSNSHFFVLSAIEVVVDFGAGYWLASVVSQRKLGHAAFMTSIAFTVQLIFIVRGMAADPRIHVLTWRHLVDYLAMSYIMVGAWWWVRKHPFGNGDQALTDGSVRRAPNASPTQD